MLIWSQQEQNTEPAVVPGQSQCCRACHNLFRCGKSAKQKFQQELVRQILAQTGNLIFQVHPFHFSALIGQHDRIKLIFPQLCLLVLCNADIEFF